VAYYVTGAEEWRYADNLDGLVTERLRLYLASSAAGANDVFHSGLLAAEGPADTPPDHYHYDPLDTRPAELEKEEVKDGLTNQLAALNLFGNGLVYHSEPFAEEVTIAGNMRLVVWLALDVPDTDFAVNVYEITPDGGSIELSSDLLRARYRHSPHEEELVTPGQIEPYTFDGFAYIARRLGRGSRLRLLFRCPNTIYLQKNYNGGGVVAQESAADARTARVTLYHDPDRPSYLELPLAGVEQPPAGE
jgi:putative CocE/NonD family hydrolase